MARKLTRIHGLGVLLLATSLAAQTPLENTGKPIQIPFECTAADSEAFGLNCSEDEPCPVYLELSGVDAAGNRIVATGNLHTPSATLYSILLATDDAGKTWTEPTPRMKSTGLDQIQFIDFETGWISGANVLSAPRDPFFLLTTDGGKTWRQRPLFDEVRVASIDRFHFDSREQGTLLVDARLDNGKYELYDTRTGGESWSIKQASTEPIRFPRQPDTSPPAWRVRADAGTHSYVIEKGQGGRGQAIASFLINAGACKE